MQNQKPVLKPPAWLPQYLKKNRYPKIVRWNRKSLKQYQLKRYQQILKYEQVITHDLRKISAQTGITMAGLDNRIKTEDSFIRKVNVDMGNNCDFQTVKKVIDATNDVIRYTYVDEANDLVKSCLCITEILKARQYRLLKVKNTWLDCNCVYKGIHGVFCAPTSQTFEIQFHTPESYELKNGELHQLYEKARQNREPEHQKSQINNKMMKLSSGLVMPDNTWIFTSWDWNNHKR